jgi:uncharacterized protein (DUF1499 family)
MASLALVVACAAGELLGGLGHRWDWWGIGAGIQTIRWSATVDVALIVVAAIIAVWAWRRRAPQALTLALAALLLGIVVGGPPVAMWRQAVNLPPIHDISTDTENPPRFVAVMALRQGARNGTDYSPATAQQQRSGYPDIAPLRLDAPPAKVFAAAERSARAMGWDIVDVAPQDGRIEATDTTLLFGFKDDVVIRIAPQGSGTRVDMRSLSRVGGSDIGANAKRIRKFMQRLADEASR